MDCVICEKCRLWGKLQMLGLGTAVKILLTPENELIQVVDGESNLTALQLNRQEIVALINTLHQFAKSIEYAASQQIVPDSANNSVADDAADDTTLKEIRRADPNIKGKNASPQTEATVMAIAGGIIFFITCYFGMATLSRRFKEKVSNRYPDIWNVRGKQR